MKGGGGRKGGREDVFNKSNIASHLLAAYPEASGGNLTTTFPLSAPGSSTNLPTSACFTLGYMCAHVCG